MRLPTCRVVLVPLLAVLLAGCGPREESGPARPTPVSPYPAVVVFRVKEVGQVAQTGSTGLRARGPEAPKQRTWNATHVAEGRTARFRIQLDIPRAEGQATPGATMVTFIRERRSDSAGFLRALGRALEASVVPSGITKENRLALQASVIGFDQSRGPSSGNMPGPFVSQPTGSWIATEVFVSEGAGEFYLNLDSARGEGEIVSKDPRYGDAILRELARVL